MKLDIKFVKNLAKYKAPSSATWDLSSLFYEGTIDQIEMINGVKVKLISTGKRKEPELVFVVMGYENQFWRIPVLYSSYEGTEIYLHEVQEVVPEQITITQYNPIKR
jgi:hypothetical protein